MKPLKPGHKTAAAGQPQQGQGTASTDGAGVNAGCWHGSAAPCVLWTAVTSRCIKTPATRPAASQAIGRTKGGLHTKLTAWVDSHGRPVQVALAPGQRADVSTLAETTWPRGLRGKTVVADKGHDSDGAPTHWSPVVGIDLQTFFIKDLRLWRRQE